MQSSLSVGLLQHVPTAGHHFFTLGPLGFFGGFFFALPFPFFTFSNIVFRFCSSSFMASSTTALSSASTIGKTDFRASSTSWRWSKLLLSSRFSHVSVYWLICSTNCCTTALGPTSCTSSSSTAPPLPFFASLPFLPLSSLAPFLSPLPFPSLPFGSASSSESPCLL